MTPRRSLSRHAGLASAALACALACTAPGAYAQSCFPQQPTANPYITSNFGYRKHPKFEGTTRLHAGTDLRAGVGAPIFAVEDGMVLFADYSASGGNMVRLQGVASKTLVYMHLNRISVKRGDLVRAGQQIGEAGNTGNASAAPHLHFEVRPQATNPVDARPFLCNPPEKPGSGPDPLLNAGAQPNGQTVTNGVPNNDYPPMGSASAAATSVPQASGMPDYQGMSLQQFLAAESERRFGNPQWYRDLNDPLDNLRNHPDPQVRQSAAEIPLGSVKTMILREIVFMMNLKDFYRMERYERRQRMEQLLATDLADTAADYTERVLGVLRDKATVQSK